MAGVPERPASPGTLQAQLQEAHEELLCLQQRLGELHAGDYNSLRRAYTALSQHVEALEQEAAGMAAAAAELETTAVPPELVARELGVAAAVSFGVALLQRTIKAMPLPKGGMPAVSQGLWLLAGGYVLARLTGGALAHMTGIFRRNAGRKRRLLRQLEVVEERIAIMVALQEWAEKQAAPPGAAQVAAAAARPAEGAAEAEAVAAEAEAVLAVAPPRRVSPAASEESGGSGELVEMPMVEELEAAEEGTAGPSGSGAAAGRSGSNGGGGGGRSRSAGAGSAGADPSGLSGLKAYVEMLRKQDRGSS